MVGINSDTLNKIQYAVRQAINGKAFPGCQVLIAKSGSIIYDESFGYYTYNKEVAVSKNSVYDLASLTKVLATTLVGMKLYELKEIDLKDSLHKYLPDSLNDYLQYPSTIRNVTFQELFTHQSGMPSGFPILEYIQYQTNEIGRYDKYYCDIKDSIYSIEVAKNFFIEKAYQDSMWIRLNKLWLDSDKNYKYSDVNMNTLYFIFKGILNANYNNFGFKKYELEQDDFDIFEAYLNKTIYKALNLKRTFYRPITKVALDEIVPTENETYWRKQLLQGYVHDPTAALYGGVAGNAGLFSSANELVVICEMLRRRGAYNGVQILDAATVDLFTQAQPNTFRGLGFNKPSINTSAFGCAPSASLKTYGHTGFTGTCFWVDPDSEMVFIFLSNRVNPKVNNRIYEYGIRKNIHQTAYDANFIN
jgi:CubicO group peptidase (beta-lactamase class C family)